jgi:hypothetical protein
VISNGCGSNRRSDRCARCRAADDRRVRHHPCVEERLVAVRLAARIWSTDNDLQSIYAPGAAWELGESAARACWERTVHRYPDDQEPVKNHAGRRTRSRNRRKCEALGSTALLASLGQIASLPFAKTHSVFRVPDRACRQRRSKLSHFAAPCDLSYQPIDKYVEVKKRSL